MKTTIIILATLLTLNTSMIFANNPRYNHSNAEPIKNETTLKMDKLNPVTPFQVNFSDGLEHMTAPDAMVLILAPIAPKEADFEEVNPDSIIEVLKLSPETPKETEFEEPEMLNPVIIGSLAPSTPAEADFVK